MAVRGSRHKINDVQRFFDQQIGKKKWISYDSCLRRLRCNRNEDFRQLLPTDDESSPVAPIFACKFAPKKGYEHLLALANEEGELAICDTLVDADRTGMKAHHNAIFDLAWMPKEMKLVTVSGDHTARLIDLTADGLQIVQMFTGHTRSVKTVAFRRNDFWVFATGSRDGAILVWDIRSSSSPIIPDNRIENSHAIIKKSVTPKRRLSNSQSHSCVSGANSVTGLAFQDDYTLISCGAGDGIIKFWDLRKTYSTSKKEALPKHVIPYSGNTLKNGFSNLVLDESCVRLYASCVDNSLYCYNVSGCDIQPVMKYVGHQNRTYYVKACLSKDDQYILSGSSDNYAYIWNISQPYPIAKLKGHTAEVTCVDWSATNMTVVTCSDDMTHKFWRFGPEYLPDNWEVDGAGETIPMTQPKREKRKIEEEETSPKAKRQRTCEKCIDKIDVHCENCNYNPRARKRLQMDQLNGNSSKRHKDTILEEPQEEEKEIQKDKNFAHTHNNDKENCSSNFGKSTSLLESVSEENEQQKEEDLMNVTPNKKAKIINGCSLDKAISNVLENVEKPVLSSGNLLSTPKSQNTRLISYENLESPTTNLPNFVIDGSAPHLNLSPTKKVDPDWLTKMSTEKRLRKRMKDLSSIEPVSPPKQQKVDTTPKSLHRRRRLADSPKSPLLRFFKITNNTASNAKEANNCSTTTTSPHRTKIQEENV